jgi:hypothetical protein
MTGIEWETKDLAESDQCPAISVSRTPKILRMYVKERGCGRESAKMGGS